MAITCHGLQEFLGSSGSCLASTVRWLATCLGACWRMLSGARGQPSDGPTGLQPAGILARAISLCSAPAGWAKNALVSRFDGAGHNGGKDSVDAARLVEVALLTLALLTMAPRTMALITMALLTMAPLTVA